MNTRQATSHVLLCAALAAVVLSGAAGCKKKEVVAVIGGYGWMAKFMDQDGYVATGGVYKKYSQGARVAVDTQYNFENTLLDLDAAWVPYEAASAEPLPFDCGACHTTGYTAAGEPAAAGYAGSESCKLCHNTTHPEILTSFPETGHQHALTAVSGQAPDMPFTDIPAAPETFRFGTTGMYDVSALAGIDGQWVEAGIGCEACHGPSLAHVNAKDDPAQRPDPAVARAACANCHVSGALQNGAVTADGVIETDGNFIALGQEWEEWLASPHSNPDDLADPAYPGCATCHNPHASTIFDDAAAGDGRKVYADEDCLQCHAGKTMGIAAMADAGVMCIDCHMPYAGKAAFGYPIIGAEGNYAYAGDIRSHQFKLRIDGKKNDFIDIATKTVKLDENGKTPGITLDLACQPCHSANGLRPHGLPAAGAIAITQLQESAAGIHPDL